MGDNQIDESSKSNYDFEFVDTYSARSTYSLIESGIYLGELKVARNVRKLQKLNVQVVLTVMDHPLRLTYQHDLIEYYYIKAFDVPFEDIIMKFPYGFYVMNQARQKDKTIFVHCRAGVSRSATVLISYLMKLHQISAQQAYNIVKRKRDIRPNDGFVEQLFIYEKTNYQLDGSNRELRLVLFNNLIHNMKFSYGFKDDYNMKLIDKTFDSYLAKLNIVEQGYVDKILRGKLFICTVCNFELFNEINIINYLEPNKSQNLCKWYFVEPMAWMKGNLRPEIGHPIKCPQCFIKLGDTQWQKYKCDCKIHENLSEYLILRMDLKQIQMKN